ncbi:MAG: helix-turn-helix transcriptional regulator [Rhizobiales bacterium]|nr:helix-turn-helix transcriptional regulator [Hyphomicrobiales bacterium]
MDESISRRNDSRQQGIFLPETAAGLTADLKCPMAKWLSDDEPEIFLGQWLDFFETDVTVAAKAAGCSQSYVSNIIANRKPNVNVLYLLRISEMLGVTVNDFYRPLPKKSELAALKDLSPKAQASILEKQRKRA